MKKLRKRIERKRTIKKVLKVLEMIENPQDIVVMYQPKIGGHPTASSCDCTCCKGRYKDDYGGLF